MTIKYRVHEVAKDFNADTKEVTEILTKYATTPKNHMQALEENELSLVFEALTQNHQMKSIEEVFAETYHEPKPVEAPKPVEPPKAVAPAPAAPVAGETAGVLLRPQQPPALCPPPPLQSPPWCWVDPPPVSRRRKLWTPAPATQSI
ncbi:MAG: translation initiation factor IF-2 N-terminal domain-containing protein, partial [Oscillospiraceae bacterium]